MTNTAILASVIFGATLLYSTVSRGGAADQTLQPSSSGPLVPVIHCTDLFHPHEDPDDHFDLATLYAIPGIELKAVILDQGALQVTRPGTIPVSQLNRITGRNVPAAIGLAEKLRSPTDPALGQKLEFQQGVELILRTLRESPVPAAISMVGSARDVVAAFNRAPGLFRRKVGKILAFIGEASDPKFIEWNVSLDPHAYVGLLRSGLPVYWVPCFDGGPWINKGHASFWQAKHEDLLRNAPPQLLQYFIYALEKEKSDALAFLSNAVDPGRKQRLLAGTRNLWAAAVLEFLAGRSGAAGPYEFSAVEVSVGDDAVVHYVVGPASKKILRFQVRDLPPYPAQMTAATAHLLSRLTPSTGSPPTPVRSRRSTGSTPSP
jgi:hypothetical protein